MSGMAKWHNIKKYTKIIVRVIKNLKNDKKGYTKRKRCVIIHE